MYFHTVSDPVLSNVTKIPGKFPPFVTGDPAAIRSPSVGRRVSNVGEEVSPSV